MPPILDTAIGTVFVFLLFSLVVSALNEMILSRFDQRAKFLHMGMQELFGEPDRSWRKGFWKKLFGGLPCRVTPGVWTRNLYNHGLINALSRTDGVDNAEGDSPSYIPAGAFVTALLDLLSKVPPRTAAGPPAAAAAIGVAPTPIGLDFLRSILGRLLQGLGMRAKAPASPAAEEAVVLTRVAQTGLRSNQAKIDEFQNKIAAAGTDAAKLLAVAQELQSMLFVGAGEAHTPANIEAWIENLSGQPGSFQLQQSLRALFLSVGKDADKFKIALEAWFNATMDRVTGWYKRFAQKWMVAIGFVLAASLNVDTIRIVEELSKNPNLAKAVAAQAESYANRGYKPIVTEEERKKEIETATAAEKMKLDEATAAEAAAEKAMPLDEAKVQIAAKYRESAQAALDSKKADLLAKAGASADAQFRDSVAELQRTGLRIGWADPKQRDMLGLNQIQPPLPGENWFHALLHYSKAYTVSFFHHFGEFLPIIFGWFLTALAASLGAPFWFDTLSRFVNVRNAGRPPGEQDPTSTATKPPPATMDKAPTAR